MLNLLSFVITLMASVLPESEFNSGFCSIPSDIFTPWSVFLISSRATVTAEMSVMPG